MALVRTAVASPGVSSFNNLGSSLTAVASSSAISVGSANNVTDHQVLVTIGCLGVTTPTTATVVNLFAYGSIDGTTYSGTTLGQELIDGTDKAITLSAAGSQGIFLGSISINNTANATYKSRLISMAAAFGALPSKYVIVVQNQSGVALQAANNIIAITEISYS